MTNKLSSDEVARYQKDGVVAPITMIQTERSLDRARTEANPTAVIPIGKRMSVPGAQSTEWMLARGASVMMRTSVTVTAIDRDSRPVLGCSLELGSAATLMTQSFRRCPRSKIGPLEVFPGVPCGSDSFKIRSFCNWHDPYPAGCTLCLQVCVRRLCPKRRRVNCDR